MQPFSFVVATSNSPTSPSTQIASPTSQPSAVTTAPSTTQAPIEKHSLDDYAQVPIVVLIVAAIVTGLVGIISTLFRKWYETEVKRIEAQKYAEIKEKNAEIALIKFQNTANLKALDDQRKRELSEKETEIMILKAEIKASKERAEKPLQYLGEIKNHYENIIEDLKKQIEFYNEQKDNLTIDTKRLKLELENKLKVVESNLHELSILEKHLTERAANIRNVSLWLESNRTRLAREACHASLQSFNAQDENAEQKQTDFINDVNKFLMIIGKCLDIGRPNLIDKVMAKITPVIDPKFYAKAFTIIRDEKVPLELTNDNEKKEIAIYLSYLIEKFRSSSN